MLNTVFLSRKRCGTVMSVENQPALLQITAIAERGETADYADRKRGGRRWWGSAAEGLWVGRVETVSPEL